MKKRVRNPELQAKQSFHVDIDGVDRAIAVNALQQALTLVVVDKGARALGVDVEAVANRGLVVVIALIHFAAALRAGGVGSGTDVAAFLAAATLGETLDDDLGVNINEQGGIERTLETDQHVVEGHSLGRGAREAVEWARGMLAELSVWRAGGSWANVPSYIRGLAGRLVHSSPVGSSAGAAPKRCFQSYASIVITLRSKSSLRLAEKNPEM